MLGTVLCWLDWMESHGYIRKGWTWDWTEMDEGH